ncbi:MAG: bifunctional riboflavin kinase/FAD synthetase [Synechococcus sp. Tobar2m-G35]|jgi:riboflavin kinase/FMN adenylyltransferase|nr:bifunctional riboflavin kinase/FAD synthetase [Synechococcus sp. Tobar2m-G35]
MHQARPIALIPLRSPQQAATPTALALGSFDGLHAGHRRVIAAAVAAANERPELVPTVVSFWPHPREVLAGEPRLRLDLAEDKLELLEPLGIAQLVLVPFDRTLALLSPAAFVEQVLVQQLRAGAVAVGENFRFGHRRSGGPDELRQLGQAAGIRVSVLPLLDDRGDRISSSRIRAALAAADLAEAARLLERPYRFRGLVVKGRGLGRGLGWPTANLQVDGRKCLPAEGVYAAWVRRNDGEPLPAVMNLGRQPTIDPEAPSAVEVHLLDRELELDGTWLTVEPTARLRSQQAFPSLQALAAQIAADADEARRRLLGLEDQPTG